MKKSVASDAKLTVTFNEGGTPQFKFDGAWDIQHLGRTRGLLLRAYRHYIRELRLTMEAK